jgi:NADPH:quinone reductase-like Zn-dependent oxidoreductase
MAQTQDLPKTHRALVLTSTSQPLEVKNVPTPQSGPGSLIAKPLAVSVISYTKDVYDGTRKYPFPMPFTTGLSPLLPSPIPT